MAKKRAYGDNQGLNAQTGGPANCYGETGDIRRAPELYDEILEFA